MLAGFGDDVASEGFASGRCAFREEVELGPIAGGATAGEDTGVGAAFHGFVVNDRELANLERFGQNVDRPFLGLAGQQATTPGRPCRAGHPAMRPDLANIVANGTKGNRVMTRIGTREGGYRRHL
jgi:hypothetical protein